MKNFFIFCAVFLVALCQAQTQQISTNKPAVYTGSSVTDSLGNLRLYNNALGWYTEQWYTLSNPSNNPTLWLSAKGGMKFFTNAKTGTSSTMFNQL